MNTKEVKSNPWLNVDLHEFHQLFQETCQKHNCVGLAEPLQIAGSDTNNGIVFRIKKDNKELIFNPASSHEFDVEERQGWLTPEVFLKECPNLVSKLNEILELLISDGTQENDYQNVDVDMLIFLDMIGILVSANLLELFNPYMSKFEDQTLEEELTRSIAESLNIHNWENLDVIFKGVLARNFQENIRKASSMLNQYALLRKLGAIPDEAFDYVIDLYS